ncbi:MAG: TIGR03663 family protein, partial [Verrucomicrobiales bacterium]|nr:TIGR03663 family protein [Verrucomicrobiales bacterium]
MNRGASQDRWWTWALLLVAVGALALRLPRLDRRPMHNDEAVNAILFGKLLEQGVYRYDPDEYHGPALHYATLPFAVLSGAKDLDHLSERTLRTVTVTAGVLMILVLGLLRDALGRAGALWAAVLLACSPAMVFYSRYFIHEMGLVLFTLLVLAAAWRYLNRPGPAWALVAGVALGLMHATKETFVFSLAAAVPAAAACTMWRRDPTSGTSANRFSVRPSHLALGFAAAALVSVTLFTSFFTHARGPIDAWATYLPWIRRAGGASPHLHPWTEYFRRLLWFQAERGPVWTEGSVAVLTLAGMI